MRKCPHCEGALAPAYKDQARLVAGTSFVVRVPALACRRCREVFVAGEMLERVDLEVACIVALRGPLIGETLRFMRKALGMRGLDMASLLDVTGETVSRWENGQRAVDPNAWVLVGSLVLEESGQAPTTMLRLQGLRKRAKLPKTVRMLMSERAPRSTPRGAAPRSSRTRVSDVA